MTSFGTDDWMAGRMDGGRKLNREGAKDARVGCCECKLKEIEPGR